MEDVSKTITIIEFSRNTQSWQFMLWITIQVTVNYIHLNVNIANFV